MYPFKKFPSRLERMIFNFIPFMYNTYT